MTADLFSVSRVRETADSYSIRQHVLVFTRKRTCTCDMTETYCVARTRGVFVCAQRLKVGANLHKSLNCPLVAPSTRHRSAPGR